MTNQIEITNSELLNITETAKSEFEKSERVLKSMSAKAEAVRVAYEKALADVSTAEKYADDCAHALMGHVAALNQNITGNVAVRRSRFGWTLVCIMAGVAVCGCYMAARMWM